MKTSDEDCGNTAIVGAPRNNINGDADFFSHHENSVTCFLPGRQ